jgi:anti-sigma B factor antagonist
MAQPLLTMPELKLEVVTTTSDETLVRCIGKMIFTGSIELQTALRRLIPETKRLVLDLAEMTYLDSFGLGVLVGLYLSAKRQHRQLKLMNLNQQGQQLLRVTNLTYLLE